MEMRGIDGEESVEVTDTWYLLGGVIQAKEGYLKALDSRRQIAGDESTT